MHICTSLFQAYKKCCCFTQMGTCRYGNCTGTVTVSVSVCMCVCVCASCMYVCIYIYKHICTYALHYFKRTRNAVVTHGWARVTMLTAQVWLQFEFLCAYICFKHRCGQVLSCFKNFLRQKLTLSPSHTHTHTHKRTNNTCTMHTLRSHTHTHTHAHRNTCAMHNQMHHAQSDTHSHEYIQIFTIARSIAFLVA